MSRLLVRLLARLIVLILTPIVVVLELLRFGRRTWHETKRRE